MSSFSVAKNVSVDKLAVNQINNNIVKQKVYSYANSLPHLYDSQSINNNVNTFSILKELVELLTDATVPDEYIAVTGHVFGDSYFHEEYSIVLNNGSKLVFSGLYSSTADGISTSDSTVEFAIKNGTGDFTNAVKVTVEYTSNIYKSRFITVYF
jgi:hypothetical protein